MTDLSGLFAPERVAVVGASEEPDTIGRALMANIDGYDGEVIPVNPDRTRVFDRECYPTLSAIPDPATVDLAVVVVPARVALDVVRQAGEAGIRNVVVISAGFGETGADGRQRQDELARIASEYDLNLVGPNCVGIISTPSGLNATFMVGEPPAGPISLMSQSGAFIGAVLSWAAQHGVGFRDVVSLGNEAVLDETDFLETWGADPGTDVILAYLEDIDDGRRFIETARAVTDSTPLVILKSGRTTAGAAAAASHTGSMAGSEEAYGAAFIQAGTIRARTIQELFDIGQVFEGQPRLASDEIAVVTNGGGPGVLATDALGDSRLSIAEFPTDARADLAEILPGHATVANPLDLIGDAGLERYRRALDRVLAVDEIGGAIVLGVPTAIFEFEQLADVVGEVQQRHGKPVVTCLMGGDAADRAAETLERYGIPNYFDPSRAVTSLAALAEHREITTRTYSSPRRFAVDSTRATEILAEATERTGDRLGLEASPLLDAYGIPQPASDIATSGDAAASIAAEIGGPVVMKIVSPDFLHKSDIGGVEIGVPVDAARETYETITSRALEHDPEATILGVQVQALVDPDAGTETIVGMSRDPQFGPLLMFGLGGIYVQVFEDTAFRVAPVSGREARAMVDDIQAVSMLRGARGRPPADIDALVETIQRVSQLVTDIPAITELDINPLLVTPDGVQALDLRLTVDPDALAEQA